ncbi:subtilisin-like protease SBT1.1 isoform X1 [Tripterygium wilfordii]|uniref:subtilisin-like protease SBT1.1 isoform X1 n=1 Tax=Tripterygium wilfordii TaxID=458696 RepID=UPI0018F838ED|nr:subtilisin-like protease SBT1.1 isoform X1 [Tripterygium wilfordii]
MISRAFFLFLALMAATSLALVEKRTYIVHMDHTKMMASNPQQWYKDLMDSVYDLSIEEEEEDNTTPPDLLYTYENVVSGFAAKLSTKQLESLEKMEGFLYANPDRKLSLHTTHTPQFLGLQAGKGLWSASNLSSDVVIGVLDTGIWPEHSSFHDSGMPPVPAKWKGKCEKGTQFSPSNCNKKLIGARYYYKGYEAANGKINQTIDFLSPRDEDGHGTHTASTAGGSVVDKASLFGFASGSASGMMYTSRIAVYKVLWEKGNGGVTTDALAAIDQAVLDGVDVLSLSLTSDNVAYYLDDIAIAAFGAIQIGVSVVCSAGNKGPSFSTVGNTAPWLMTIAASYLDRSFAATVTLGNGLSFQGSSLSQSKATKHLRLVYGKTAGGEGADHCIPGSLDHNLVKGKIVVCKNGKDDRAAIGELVKLAGGAGMLLLNTESEGEELIADPHVLPAIGLGVSKGKAIIKYLNSSEKPTASIIFEGTVYGTRAPMMALFSSRGPNEVDPNVIKPDVTAPGVNILAAWPPIVSPSLLTSDKRSVKFNIFSGTSMSCPHVSGLVALLKSVHKNWSPAAIKSALMTTAYTMDNRKIPIADVAHDFEPATPFALGSGHVNPEVAVDPGLVYDITAEDYLIYLCLKYTSYQMAAVSRRRFTCPKKISPQPGNLNYPSFAVNFEGKAKNVSLTFRRTLTNVGTPKSSYMVHLEEPNGVVIVVKPTILKFRKLGQKLNYKVTFIGYKITKNPTFGSLVWMSRKYSVISPIAATWQ